MGGSWAGVGGEIGEGMARVGEWVFVLGLVCVVLAVGAWDWRAGLGMCGGIVAGLGWLMMRRAEAVDHGATEGTEGGRDGHGLTGTGTD